MDPGEHASSEPTSPVPPGPPGEPTGTTTEPITTPTTSSRRRRRWISIVAGLAMVGSLAYISYIVLGAGARYLVDEADRLAEERTLALRNQVQDCRFERFGEIWQAKATVSNPRNELDDLLVEYSLKGETFSSNSYERVLALEPGEERVVELWTGGAAETEASMSCNLGRVWRIVVDDDAAEQEQLVAGDVSNCRIEESDDGLLARATVTNSTMDTPATYVLNYRILRDGEPVDASFAIAGEVAPDEERDVWLAPADELGAPESLSCEITDVRRESA